MPDATNAATYVEATREIPAFKYDVVVGGGGPAGFGAALGAARAGAKTLLVERNSFLGGTATAGLMAQLAVTRDKMVGAARDLWWRMEREGSAWMDAVVAFSPEAMKQTALEMLEEAGCDLLFYTMASQPIVEDGAVKGLIVENKSGRQALLSHVLIDCTGDGDIAYRAGAPTVFGREQDGRMRPMTLLFRLGNIDLSRLIEYARANPEQFDPQFGSTVIAPENGVVRLYGFFEIMENARARGEVDPNIHYLRLEGVDMANGTVIVNTVRVYNLSGADARELTRGEIEARRQMMQLVEVIRKYVPGCERAFLIDAAVNMGVRETRRVVGEHVFTDEDAWNKVHFDDTVLHLWRRAERGQEMHTPDAGEGLRDADFYERIANQKAGVAAQDYIRDYYFPYRSLVPLKVDGLLVAGRCMSVSHFGDVWTRGMMVIMACGQAAGVGAAVAAKQGVAPRQVDVAAVRAELARQGVDVG